MTNTPLSLSAPAAHAQEVATEPVVSPIRRKRPSPMVVLTAGWLFLVIFLAVFAHWLPVGKYNVAVGSGEPNVAPFTHGGLDMVLGTDSVGRSILARTVYGARVSLVVGTTASLVGFVLGTLLGMVGGYFRGKVDLAISILADAMLAFPPIVLLLAMAAVLEPSLKTLLVGLSFIVTPGFIRLARGNTLAWASQEFVVAARNMGAGHPRVLFKELLPSVLPPVATYLPIVIAALIVAEGSLSFLGLGVPPPTPSWGGMIAAGKDSLATDPQLVMVPSLAIFLTVYSLNTVGDHLHDRFDRTER